MFPRVCASLIFTVDYSIIWTVHWFWQEIVLFIWFGDTDFN
jgi:hypothetical protein